MKDKLLEKIQKDRSEYWDGGRYIHKDEREMNRESNRPTNKITAAISIIFFVAGIANMIYWVDVVGRDFKLTMFLPCLALILSTQALIWYIDSITKD